MKIVVFAGLTYWNRSYSLSGIIQDQIKMFVREGHDVKVIVARGMANKEELEKVCPNIYEAIVPGDPVETKENTKRVIQDADWVITHDIVWVHYYDWINAIFRELEIELPQVKFGHMVHSAPGNPDSEPCTDNRKARKLANVWYIYGNKTDAPRLAQYIGADSDRVIPIRYTHGMWDEMGGDEALYEKLGLFDVDMVGFYPAHPMPGKNIPAMLKILAEMKNRGMSFKYLFTVNGCPKGSEAYKRVDGYKVEAKNLGIENDVVWMLDYPEWENNVPYDVVQKLWKITDIFLMPSWSEVNPLMLVEAMANKCLIVGNLDCAPVVEMTGKDVAIVDSHNNPRKINGAIFHQFGNHIRGDQIQSPEMISQLVDFIETFGNNSLPTVSFRRVRKNFNSYRIYKHEWEPFLLQNQEVTQIEVEEKEKISVVIPIYNLTDELVSFTHKAIKSVRQYPNSEIVLVQNNPDDNNYYDADVVIKNDANVGVSRAWNQGLREVTGDVIVIMNSDVELPPTWGEKIIDATKSGAMVFPWVEDKCVGTGSGIIPPSNFKFPDTHGSFFAAKRVVFNKIGPFDENFWAYGEDKDYWKRCVINGVNAYRADFSYKHIMNATSGTASNMRKLDVNGEKMTLHDLLVKNGEIYMRKWGEPL